MKRLSLFVGTLVFAFLLSSCGKEETFQIDDWVGNWKTTGEAREIVAKAYQGTISKDGENLIIRGSLFNMNSSIQVRATLSGGNTVSFNDNSQGFSISGTGKMEKKNEIQFEYTIEDEANKNTYASTAVRM